MESIVQNKIFIFVRFYQDQKNIVGVICLFLRNGCGILFVVIGHVALTYWGTARKCKSNSC